MIGKVDWVRGQVSHSIFMFIEVIKFATAGANLALSFTIQPCGAHMTVRSLLAPGNCAVVTGVHLLTCFLLYSEVLVIGSFVNMETHQVCASGSLEAASNGGSIWQVFLHHSVLEDVTQGRADWSTSFLFPFHKAIDATMDSLTSQ